MADTPAVCEAPPSAYCARDLMAGDLSALPAVLATMALRTGLVAASTYAAGRRKDVWVNALAGVAAVEVSILLWFAKDEADRRAAIGTEIERCPELPTTRAASQLAAGDLRGLPTAVVDSAARAGELAAGMWLGGNRRPRELARDAVAGSLGVELFLVGYSLYKRWAP